MICIRYLCSDKSIGLRQITEKRKHDYMKKKNSLTVGKSWSRVLSDVNVCTCIYHFDY